MVRRFLFIAVCFTIVFVSGCAKHQALIGTPAPAAPTSVPRTTAQPSPKLPTNVPYHKVVRVQESTSGFGDSSTTALKETYDILVNSTISQEDISKVVEDVQVRESIRNPNIDWMFFNVYDDEFDVGGKPTRGKGVWAELVGVSTCVSEKAAASNNHSANRLSVTTFSYPSRLRYTNGDGYDPMSNTITPFEDELYSTAENLYAQFANAQQTGQAGNADFMVADKLSQATGMPRSMVVKLHRKVKRLKALGVATTGAAAETAGQQGPNQ